ncbi:protein containing DUF1016 [mine drainage metagenome]|uniref:Protein containing DUF1016 n=1 Tax=mine drainage metagenome TaxID=410659 RepID=T0ZI35_9ZZZZ
MSQTVTTPDSLLVEIRTLIEDVRRQVARSINGALTLTYWRIGKRLLAENLTDYRAEYGQRILVSLIQELTWTHFLALLPLKDALAREFYAEMCRIERWSVRALRQMLAAVKKRVNMTYPDCCGETRILGTNKGPVTAPSFVRDWQGFRTADRSCHA